VADRKISDLTALTTPATGDLIPIVDISEAAAADKNKSITVGELLRGAPDGTAAAPGIAFESDGGNGIYKPGTDQVAISTNGTQRVNFGTSEVVFNDDDADVDFRIEGNTNANLFFVDAGNNRVGIGTSTPTALLEVQGAEVEVDIDATSGRRYRVISDSSGNFKVRDQTGASDRLTLDSTGNLGLGTSSPGSILDIRQTQTGAETKVSVFNTDTANTTTQTASIGLAPDSRGGAFAGIEAIKVNADFSTNAGRDVALALNTTLNNAKNQAVYITHAGNVGIGTTSPSFATGSGLEIERSGAATLRLEDSSGSGGSLEIFADDGVGSAVYDARGDASNRSHIFRLQGNEAARIDSSSRLLVGTSTSRAVAGNTAQIQLEGSTTYQSIAVTTNRNDTTGAYLFLSKSRGAENGSTTVVQLDDTLGGIYFIGADGSSSQYGAAILGQVDGAASSGDMPGRLVFYTTPDGTSGPTARLRIGNNGNTLFQNITNYVAPDSDNAVSNGASGRRWSEIWAANGTIQTSDERAKNEITDATLGADFIKALRPVSYKWIEGGKRHTGEYDEENNFVYESIPGKRTHWGFIAQEVKQIVDDAGVDFGGWVLTDKDDPDSEQALRYDQFIAPLTKALQEALAKIETLEQRLNDAGIA